MGVRYLITRYGLVGGGGGGGGGCWRVLWGEVVCLVY